MLAEAEEEVLQSVAAETSAAAFEERLALDCRLRPTTVGVAFVLSSSSGVDPHQLHGALARGSRRCPPRGRGMIARWRSTGRRVLKLAACTRSCLSVDFVLLAWQMVLYEVLDVTVELCP